LTHPEEVLTLHRCDVAAGSQVLFTNTFGANRSWLARYGRSDAVEAVNRRSVDLARQAAGPKGFVVGDIGPSAAQLAGAAADQAAALVDAGVDALVFETYRAEPVERVLREVKSMLSQPVPLFVSLWQWPQPPGTAARRLLDLDVAVLGLNCQPGIDAAIAFSRQLHQVVSCPLLVKPSATGADPPDPRATPASFAEAVPQLIERGVRLLGGCCGTTEAHVAALAAACAPFQDRIRPKGPGVAR
jgi:methionine synthase I (cobalamin-dependent)